MYLIGTVLNRTHEFPLAERTLYNLAMDAMVANDSVFNPGSSFCKTGYNAPQHIRIFFNLYADPFRQLISRQHPFKKVILKNRNNLPITVFCFSLIFI